MDSWARRNTWELLLGGILAVVVVFDLTQSTGYLSVDNFVNLFQLHIEKMIVVIPMTFVIISGEIDLSVAAVANVTGTNLALCLYESPVDFDAASQPVTLRLYNGTNVIATHAIQLRRPPVS